MPILSFILWTPLLGALLIACLPSGRRQFIRGIAYAATGTSFVLALSLLGGFDPADPTPQYLETMVWNPELGSYYALAIDGFSLPMLLLSTLLSLVALQASASIEVRAKGYHVWFLALQFGMLGVFLAADWSLFFVFWEATLIPLFFLIDQWGGARRHSASLNFVLYTMGGSVFMLMSLLTIFTASPEHSTGMQSMLRAARDLPMDRQTWLLLGFLVAFGVKMPLFPLHGWLPLAHVEAPGPISILLSGALLKMGAYGLLKAIAMLPQGALALQGWLAGIGLVGILYGALLAFRQTDFKAMIAYSSISHMGLVLLGIAAFNTLGLSGAVLQMAAHGLSAGVLFYLAGVLYARTHTRDITRYRALVHFAPGFSFLLSLALLSGMGFPGLGGFVAELLILVGGYQAIGVPAALMSLGVLVGGIYTIRALRGFYTGNGGAGHRPTMALQRPEVFAAAALLTAILTLGLRPSLLTTLSTAKISEIATLLAPARTTGTPVNQSRLADIVADTG